MLGIAVISYNRIEGVKNTIKHIQDNTLQPYELVVADDGSPDGSTSILRGLGHAVVSGKNMGVCWNKNRALFYLSVVKKCSTVILIEDDVWPTAPGWETDWIEAARYHGHVNFAGDWFSEGFVSGSGAPKDPFISRFVSGQCSAYSAEALSYVGYLDTRFRGYGVGHVEHTRRFIRAGYGGLLVRIDTQLHQRFALIKSTIRVDNAQSYKDKEQVAKNEKLFTEIKDEPVYRSPWRTDGEMAQFRGEIRAADSPGQRGDFDEEFYLRCYPDVAAAIAAGAAITGEAHYRLHGQFERRLGRYLHEPPP
jgi:glycosyltransferase involved in cell wall biosynthesis